MIDAEDLARTLFEARPNRLRAHVGHAARVEAFAGDALGTDAAEALLAPHRRPLPAIVGALSGPRHACAVLTDANGAHAVFARARQGRLERAWMLSPVGAAQPPLLGLEVPRDPRMSQLPPQPGFAPELHPEFAPVHAAAMLASVARITDGDWDAARAQAMVVEAFSDRDAWAVLARLEGERERADGGVAQIGAWAVLLEAEGRSLHVVDAWEPAARLAAPWRWKL